jgi:uncharacterized membrane protein
MIEAVPILRRSSADGHQGGYYHLRTKSVCNTVSSMSPVPGAVLIGLVL